MKHERKKTKGEGANLQSINKDQGAIRPPIGRMVGPTMVLICEINMIFQIVLSAIKFHLPVKQLMLILSMLLLPLINGNEP